MSRCRKCGEPIRWEKSPSGRNVPMDIGNNETHFATCSKPKGWFTREYWIPIEQIKNKGNKFSNPVGLKSFYFGKTPPWEYPTFIACIE